MREGRVALWNPLVFEGSFQLPALYPPDLLHALWPSPVFVSWLLTLHLPLAALAAYWLARELGASRPGAFRPGAVYALSAASRSPASTSTSSCRRSPSRRSWSGSCAARRCGADGRCPLAALGRRARRSPPIAVEFVAQAVLLGGALGLAASPSPADPRAAGGRGPARRGPRGAAGGSRGRPAARDRARGGPGARRRPRQRRSPRRAAPGPAAEPVRRAPGAGRGLVGRAVLQQGAALLPLALRRPPDPGPGGPGGLRAAAPRPPRRARAGGARPVVRARGAGRPRSARRQASPGVVVPLPGQGAAAAALRGGPGLRLRRRPAACREPALGRRSRRGRAARPRWRWRSPPC